MSPRAKRKTARKAKPKTLEVQVRELRNDVNKITVAVEQIEMSLGAPWPCWACWPSRIPQLCQPGIIGLPLCGPPMKRRKR